MTLVLLHLQVYQSLFLTDSQVTGQSLAFSLRHARNCMVTKLLALISEILQISSWVIAFDPLFELIADYLFKYFLSAIDVFLHFLSLSALMFNTILAIVNSVWVASSSLTSPCNFFWALFTIPKSTNFAVDLFCLAHFTNLLMMKGLKLSNVWSYFAFVSNSQILASNLPVLWMISKPKPITRLFVSKFQLLLISSQFCSLLQIF